MKNCDKQLMTHFLISLLFSWHWVRCCPTYWALLVCSLTNCWGELVAASPCSILHMDPCSQYHLEYSRCQHILLIIVAANQKNKFKQVSHSYFYWYGHNKFTQEGQGPHSSLEQQSHKSIISTLWYQNKISLQLSRVYLVYKDLSYVIYFLILMLNIKPFLLF